MFVQLKKILNAKITFPSRPDRRGAVRRRGAPGLPAVPEQRLPDAGRDGNGAAEARQPVHGGGAGRRIRVQRWLGDGGRAARRALEGAREPDRPSRARPRSGLGNGPGSCRPARAGQRAAR